MSLLGESVAGFLVSLVRSKGYILLSLFISIIAALNSRKRQTDGCSIVDIFHSKMCALFSFLSLYVYYRCVEHEKKAINGLPLVFSIVSSELNGELGPSYE